jgi:Cu(I)/Ag(I) efflux system protein CusF
MKTLLLVAVLFGPQVVHAATGASPTVLAQANAMTAGEVRKVDKEQGKLTIRHEPLTNLEMPAMTMVFRVKDPAMLDQVKEGDKIRFVAERIDGAITIVEWEPAK